jgi:hypothetical protein
VVPPTSHGISRVPRYSGYRRINSGFAYGILTLYDMPSHAFLLPLFNSLYLSITPKVLLLLVWPLPLSLATTRRISFDFSSSAYLDVSVQQVPFLSDTRSFQRVGFPIRTSTDLGSFAAPRGFSQLVASFFGSQCQGIPLVLFLT